MEANGNAGRFGKLCSDVMMILEVNTFDLKSQRAIHNGYIP